MNDVERPPPGGPDRPSAHGLPAADLAWEGDLVELLSALEAARVEVESACERGRGLEAVEALRTMGALIAAFAERRSDVDDDGAANTVLAAFTTTADRLRDRLDRSAAKAVLRLFGWHSSGGDPHAQFLTAFERLLVALEAHFALFGRRFTASAAGRGWDEASGVFLAELHGLLARLRA
jgi:hypothetical protein